MYILGYSGLNAITNFYEKNLDAFRGSQGSINQGMDAAACLIKGGKIIAAAEEERFINEKHTCQFPIHAINYCLNAADITINEIDYICHNFNFKKYKDIYYGNSFNRNLYDEILSEEAQKKCFKSLFQCSKIDDVFQPIEHHYAHAASTYYPSNFEEALIFIADGMGEIHSISLFHGLGKSIEPLAHFDLFSSIGMLYSLITLHLGFLPNSDEYKVMGLAPYGDKEKYKDYFSKLILLESEGEIIIPRLMDNDTDNHKFVYGGFRTYLTETLCPTRSSSQEITQIHKDIAAALQQRTNDAIFHLLNFWQAQTELKYCCMAGGVALNCVANSVISESNLFSKIYIPPAAGDAGTALGAALYHYNHATTNKRHIYSKSETLPYYGYDVTAFIEKDIDEAYSTQLNIQTYTTEQLTKEVAKLIVDNHVVAWMQGRMEFGPRALGNRSILANPLNPKMRDIVNTTIKMRESFRPFAPSIKEEDADRFFNLRNNANYEYMLFICEVKDEFKNALPAVVHVDKTARIQTVNKQVQPLYWCLLDEFEKLTGYPILLNTSFNLNGQAIVCLPKQGIETFLNSKIDVLIINNLLLTRKA